MKTTTPSRSALARRFVPVVALLMATTFNQSAAEAEKEPTVPADPHLVELPELVVTARRIEEHPLDVPAYTNVITREQIEKSGAGNLIELLKSQANLSFTSLSSSPTNTKVSMRGTGNGDNNGRALILIDGIRANRPDMGQFNWLQFAVQDIESIEVIQGPQGGYYGDNAVGGVIKINIRKNPEKSGGQVSALVGSNATVKTSGGYTQTVGNTWGSLSGGHDESDGYRDHSGYTADSGAVTVGYDNKKNSVTQFGVSYIETEFEQPGGMTLAQFHENPRQDGGAVSDGWSKTYRISGNNQFGSKNQSQIITDVAYFNAKEYSNQNSLFGSSIFNTKYNRSIDGCSIAPKAVVVIEKGRIIAGLDTNYDQLSSTSSSPSRGELSRKALAPYMGGDWAASEKLTFSTVARHEFNRLDASGTPSTSSSVMEREVRTEDQNAYQIAANYRPSKGTRVFTKYDHTYRFPATDEIAGYQGFGLGPSFNSFFNKNLKPESSDNLELGGDAEFNAWHLGGSVYHMTTSNEIFYNSTSNLNENIKSTERNGLQARLGYDRCYYGFRAQGDYVLARVRENGITAAQQAGQLPMTPVFHATETFFFLPIAKCIIELTHNYTGGSDSTYSQAPAKVIRLPSYNTFDLNAIYQISGAWQLATGVKNLADTKSMGAAYNTDFQDNTIYSGEGRFVYMGGTYKF